MGENMVDEWVEFLQRKLRDGERTVRKVEVTPEAWTHISGETSAARQLVLALQGARPSCSRCGVWAPMRSMDGAVDAKTYVMGTDVFVLCRNCQQGLSDELETVRAGFFAGADATVTFDE